MAIRSPCISVCRLTDDDRWCEGCLRTLAEIAAWGTMTDAARRDVLARIEARRAGIELADGPGAAAAGAPPSTDALAR
jgi:predicted Fe-S protein YdhL (DUF1289 family)